MVRKGEREKEEGFIDIKLFVVGPYACCLCCRQQVIYESD